MHAPSPRAKRGTHFPQHLLTVRPAPGRPASARMCWAIVLTVEAEAIRLRLAPERGKVRCQRSAAANVLAPIYRLSGQGSEGAADQCAGDTVIASVDRVSKQCAGRAADYEPD